MPLHILDWRDLPRHPKRNQGRRPHNATYLTIHYNGPAIPQQRTLNQWYEHLRFIAEFHMGEYLNADGIQYHYAVLPDGEVAQTRDDDAILWHCGNATGNVESLAIHLPLGGSQRPSAAQWNALDELLDWLRSRHQISTNRVFGHRQWPRRSGMASIHNGQMPGQSACPGDVVMGMLAEWRAEQGTRYVVKYRANVREAPDVAAPIAWGGTAVLPVGYVVEGGTMVQGVPFKGDARWLHWPGGGFLHFSALTQA